MQHAKSTNNSGVKTCVDLLNNECIQIGTSVAHHISEYLTILAAGIYATISNKNTNMNYEGRKKRENEAWEINT